MAGLVPSTDNLLYVIAGVGESSSRCAEDTASPTVPEHFGQADSSRWQSICICKLAGARTPMDSSLAFVSLQRNIIKQHTTTLL
jgi:hypothetical protein